MIHELKEPCIYKAQYVPTIDQPEIYSQLTVFYRKFELICWRCEMCLTMKITITEWQSLYGPAGSYN